LPERDQIFFFGKVSNVDEQIYGLQSLSFTDIDRLEKGEYTAIVSSPFLLPLVSQIQPKSIIAFLDPVPDDEDVILWQKFTGLLAAQAHLIGSRCEGIYLEQCLRHDNVMLLENENKECEAIWAEAVMALGRGEPLDPWKQRQWESRLAYYKELYDQVGDDEKVCYRLALYLYFLGRSIAKHYLTISFEQAILKNYRDCLSTHYRFFSAIEAKAGNFDLATRHYAITAITDEEKLNVKSLYGLLEQNRTDLVQADIFKLNKDYRSAIHLLKASADPDASRFLLSNYLHSYRWEEALTLLEKLELAVTERYFVDGICGILNLIRGKRHEAIHLLLRASVHDWKVLSNFDEIDHWEHGMGKVIRRLNDVE
jgi:hypothetical protein